MEFSVKSIIDPRLGYYNSDHSGTIIVSGLDAQYDVEIDLHDEKVYMVVFEKGEKILTLSSSIPNSEKVFLALEKVLECSSILSPVSSRHLG